MYMSIIIGIVLFLLSYLYFYNWCMTKYRYDEKRLGGLAVERYIPEEDFSCEGKGRLIGDKVYATLTCYEKDGNDRYETTRAYNKVDYQNIEQCLYPLGDDPIFTCLLV